MPDNGDIYSSRIMLQTSENFDNIEVGCEIIQHKHESFLQRLEKCGKNNDFVVAFASENNQSSNKLVLLPHNESCLLLNDLNPSDSHKTKIDGAVLTNNEDNNFVAANDISPIIKERHMISNENYMEEEHEHFTNDNLFDEEKGSAKRKRSSEERLNISMQSTESFATSTHETSKKPKLVRTGSITKNLRRSMSFAAMKTPINNIFRLGRNTNDNCSFTSITSNESTFNESFRAVKSKIRQMKNKITKLNKIGVGAPNAAKTKIMIESEDLACLKKVSKMNSAKGLLSRGRTPERNKNDSCIMEFKTPIAPRQSTSISKSFLNNQTFQNSFNPKSQSSSKNSSPSKTDNSSHMKANQSVIQPNEPDHVELTTSCMLNVFAVAELSPVFKKTNAVKKCMQIYVSFDD